MQSILTIAPHHHFFRNWDARARIRFSEGIVERAGCFYPEENWRDPTDEELAHLAGDELLQDRNGKLHGHTVLIFTIPDRIQGFFSTYAQKLSKEDNAHLNALDKEAGKGVRDLASFLSFIQAPIDKDCSVHLELIPVPKTKRPSNDGAMFCSDISIPSDVLETGSAQASSVSAWINVGKTTHYISFLDLATEAMDLLRRGRAASSSGQLPASDTSRRLSRVDDASPQRVVRLALNPGEGVFADLDQIAHGICWSDATEITASIVVSAN